MQYSHTICRRVDMLYSDYRRPKAWQIPPLAKFLEEEVNPTVKVVSHQLIHAKPQQSSNPRHPELKKRAKTDDQAKKKKK
jgi:hypothetical protein